MRYLCSPPKIPILIVYWTFTFIHLLQIHIISYFITAVMLQTIILKEKDAQVTEYESNTL